MHENFFQRARRVVATGVEGALGAAEKASGPALLRQAVRDLEYARNRLIRARAKAEHEAQAAADKAKRARAEAAQLGKDATYAMDRGREDLARQALADQIACENQAKSLDEEAKAAKERAKELDQAVTDMESEVARAREDVAQLLTGGKVDRHDGTKQAEKADKLVQRSRALIERMSDKIGAGSGSIEALRREEEIDARLEKLREVPKKSAKKARKRA